MKFNSLLLFIPVLVAACESPAAQAPMLEPPAQTQNITHIDAATAKELIEKQNNITLLDVRTLAEYENGHIADAALYDVTAPDFRQNITALDKNKTYLIYCRSGNRSQTALKIMREEGFGNVIHMDGGYRAWRQLP